MNTEYTDIVARFTDGVAADTLAKFIASLGIPCDVSSIWNEVRNESLAIRVERSRIADLRRGLDLKPVATKLTATAAQILAGRLARENVPSYVGGLHTYSPFGDFDVPIQETTQSDLQGGVCMVAVPGRFLRSALRIVNRSPMSDEALTKLALAEKPETPT